MSEEKREVTSFKQGKIKRNELELPTLHFITMDQWLDVIGERALIAWLKMYSYCKRDEETTDNQWEISKIPTSTNQLIKRLGVGRETFYKKILSPLWNVGLIDIEEFKDSENKGTKPINFIIYKYPQNDKALSFQELKKVRDYDSDYHSNARVYGAIRNSEVLEVGEESKLAGCTDSVQGGVPNQYTGVYQSGTGGCTRLVHNNSLNSINNSLNSINKNLNKTTTSNPNNSDVAEIIQFWDSNNFGLNNIHAKQSLLSFLDIKDFDNPKEMILKAMEIACGNEKRTLNYIIGILKNWRNQGIKSLGMLEKHESKRQKQKPFNKQGKSTEIIPDWFKEREQERVLAMQEVAVSEEDIGDSEDEMAIMQAILDKYKQNDQSVG